jgi:hypothetical protein
VIEPWQTEEAKVRLEEKRAAREEFAARANEEKAELAAEVAAVLSEPAVADSPVKIESPTKPCWFDWSQWEEKDCEEVVLGWIYRTRHSKPIGTPADIKFSKLSSVGVPESEALLVPMSHRQSGPERVLKTEIRAHKIAAACVLREDDMLSQADGTAGSSLQKIMEAGKDWREDEKVVHGELEFRLKKLFVKWVERGWLIPEPVLKFSPGDSSGRGRDGLPDCCQLTYKAVDAAEDRIRGTPLAKGPDSRLETATEGQRQAAPQWYKDDERRSKAGT